MSAKIASAAGCASFWAVRTRRRAAAQHALVPNGVFSRPGISGVPKSWIACQGPAWSDSTRIAWRRSKDRPVQNWRSIAKAQPSAKLRRVVSQMPQRNRGSRLVSQTNTASTFRQTNVELLHQNLALASAANGPGTQAHSRSKPLPAQRMANSLQDLTQLVLASCAATNSPLRCTNSSGR